MDAKGNFYFADARWKRIYRIDPVDPEHTMTVLPETDYASVGKVSQALHPANRWREDNSFLKAAVREPEKAFLAPDGETVIPGFYDLIRSNAVYAAVPGKKVFLVDEYYKRTVSFTVRENGLLEDPAVFAEHGEYSAAVDEKNGRVYIAEGDILVYDTDGTFLKRITLEKRPTTVTVGGPERNILFVTAVDSVYAVRI